MKNKMKKRFSFAMGLFLALALIPVNGLTMVEVKADVDPAKAACVDQVTGKYFNTVQDAVDYFNENYGSPKLKLLRDTAENTISTAPGKHYELDLNGYTMSAKAYDVLYNIAIYNDSFLTINDSSAAGTGKIVNKAWHDPEDTPLAATIYVNDGWLFINGGTFEAVNNHVISRKITEDRGFIEIHGGTFIKHTKDKGYDTIHNENAARFVEIYGGRFSDDAVMNRDHIEWMDVVIQKNPDDGYYEPAPAYASIWNEDKQIDEYYLTLQQAYEAVQEDQAIRLVRDIDLGDSTFETNKSYTLDLNRHTLKSSAEQTVLSTGGSFTIQGDYFWHEGWLKNTHSSGSAVRATGGDLTINFGEYSGAYGVTAAGGNTAVDINSWYQKTFIKGSTASVAVEGGATFNINDGYYSDNAGNARGFTRPEGKALLQITKGDHKGMYKLENLDMSALEKAIEDAQKDYDDTPASADGKDIPDGSTYVSQDVKDALSQAIETANDAYENPTGQSEVNAAAATLNTAKQTFDDAKQTAVVDRSALEEAVNAAIDPTGIQASENGSDVPDKKNWATAEDLDAYKVALNTAKEVLPATDATQNGVDEALQNLNAAAEKIQTAEVDRVSLENAVGAALKPADIQASDDGTDVPDEKNWAKPENLEAYQTALEHATEVLEDKNATQNGVDESLQALLDAAQNIQRADVVRDDLKASIDEATTAKQDTAESVDGKDLPKGSVYVTPEVAQTLQDAIDAANRVFLQGDASQDQVDDAKKALGEALQAFDDAKQTAEVIRKDLQTAIDEAAAARQNTAESTDGRDLPDGSVYVSPEEAQTFADAIAEAQQTLDDPAASQNDVDAAEEKLSTAAKAFSDAGKTASVDWSALQKAVEEAVTPGDITASPNGNDVVDPGLWATAVEKAAYEEAFQNAGDVLTDPEATQNAVDEAIEALQDAAGNIRTGNRVYITYDPSGGVLRGSTGPITEPRVKGTSIKIPEAPVREGYTFLYWKGSEYQPGESYEATEHHTFTAQWQKINQSDNDGSESGSDTSGNGSGNSGSDTSGNGSGNSGSGTSGSGSGNSGSNTSGSGSGNSGSNTSGSGSANSGSNTSGSGSANAGSNTSGSTSRSTSAPAKSGSASDKSTSSVDSVKMGDENNIGLWLSLMFLAAVGYIGTMYFGKGYLR